MSRVRIPPVLRSHTGGARELDVQGATVGEVLQRLAEEHPGLKGQLFENGNLQRYINVYLNNQDIQYLEKLDTPAGASDTVIILPAMAGG